MSSIGDSGCYQDVSTHVPLKQTNFAYFVISGGSGAVGTITDPAKVISGIVRNSAGNYTVTLNTKWVYLLPAVTVNVAGLTASVTDVTQGNSAANAFTFEVETSSSGTATDPADTKRVQLFIEGSRRAEFTP